MKKNSFSTSVHEIQFFKIVKIGKNYQIFKNNKNYINFSVYFASLIKQNFLKKYIK